MTGRGDQADPFGVVAAALGCAPGSLSNDSGMYRDHGWDSFGHVSVITAIEDALGISIPNDDVTKLTTMSAIVAFFDRHRRVGPV